MYMLYLYIIGFVSKNILKTEMNETERENSTLVELEDFEVFDTRDQINVIAYSLMSSGKL